MILLGLVERKQNGLILKHLYNVNKSDKTERETNYRNERISGFHNVRGIFRIIDVPGKGDKKAATETLIPLCHRFYGMMLRSPI